MSLEAVSYTHLDVYKRQLLDGVQQMLTVHALDEAGTAQHFFNFVRLQMADKVAGLAAVSTCVKVCAQLLHMVLTEHIDGQGCACSHGLCLSLIHI